MNFSFNFFPPQNMAVLHWLCYVSLGMSDYVNVCVRGALG